MSGQGKRKAGSGEDADTQRSTSQIRKDNIPNLPVLGKDYPLTADVKAHQVHYIFWPNMIQPAGVSLMHMEWKTEAHDNVMIRSLTEFVLGALERPNKTGSSITIRAEDKDAYALRDPGGTFEPVVPIGEKNPSEYIYRGVYMREPETNREHLKYSVAVEHLMKHSAIPEEVLRRRGVGRDPLFFEPPDQDPTDLRQLFGAGGLEKSLGGILISIIVYDPLFDISGCMTSLMTKNHNARAAVERQMAHQDNMVSTFLPPQIDSEIGFGGAFRDQAGMLNLSSALSGDQGMIEQVMSRMYLSGMNNANFSTGTGIPFTLSSSSVSSQQRLTDLFKNYRETVMAGTDRARRRQEARRARNNDTTATSENDNNNDEDTDLLAALRSTTARRAGEDAGSSSSAAPPAAANEDEALDALLGDTSWMQGGENNGRGRGRIPGDADEGYRSGGDSGDGDDDEIEDTTKIPLHQRRPVFRESEKIRQKVYYPAEDHVQEEHKVRLLTWEELEAIMAKHKIWTRQRENRVINNGDGTITFRAPVPSCAFLIDTPYPRFVRHVIFPQSFMLALAMKEGDMAPTCAFLYQAGRVGLQEQIKAMGVKEMLLPNGESIRTLQLPDEIGFTREAERRHIRQMHTRHGTKVSGDLYKKYIHSCIAQMRAVLHGQNDYSTALNALNKYFCVDGEKRTMCYSVPHFQGLCPGSDAMALDTMIFTELGCNIPTYGEICYTTITTVWQLQKMLGGHYFIPHIILNSSAGMGKSEFFKLLAECIVAGMMAEWGDNTAKADYQLTKKDEFSVKWTDEAPKKATQTGVATAEQDNITKKKFADYHLSLDRTTKRESDVYMFTLKIKVYCHNGHIGGSNDKFTVQKCRQNALPNRFQIIPLPISLKKEDQQSTITSSHRTGKEHVANRRAYLEMMRDQQASISMAYVQTAMGILWRPDTSFLDLIIFRLVSSGTIIPTALRDFGRKFSMYDNRIYKEAIYCLTRSAGSPLLTWLKEMVTVSAPGAAGATAIDLLVEKFNPSSPHFDPKLVFLALPFLRPSWDSVMHSIALAWWHHVAIAHRAIQQLFVFFGMDYKTLRRHVRAADQRISWGLANLTANEVAARPELKELMLPPGLRTGMTPLQRSMLHWDDVDVDHPITGWLPVDADLNSSACSLHDDMMAAVESLGEPVVDCVTDMEEEQFLDHYLNGQEMPDEDSLARMEASGPSSAPSSSSSSSGSRVRTSPRPPPVGAPAPPEAPTTAQRLAGWDDSTRKTFATEKCRSLKKQLAFNGIIPLLAKVTHETAKCFDKETSAAVRSDLQIGSFPGLPSQVSNAHSKLKSFNSSKINFGAHSDNVALMGDKSPYLPWAITSARDGRLQCDMNYLQVVADKSWDIVEMMNELIRALRGINKEEEVPETEMFFSAIREKEEILPVLPSDVDIMKLPSTPGEFAPYLTQAHLMNCKTEKMPVMKRVLAPNGSVTIKETPSAGTGGAAGGPTGGNNGPKANAAEKSEVYVVHISVLWLLMKTTDFVTHMSRHLTSPYTARGRKIVLPIPSDHDPRVNMVIELGPGTGSTKFADTSYVSKKISGALRNIHTNSRKTGKKTSENFSFDDCAAQAKISMPRYDEERYFCEKWNTFIGLKSQAAFPTVFRDYLEQELVGKRKYPIAVIDKIDHTNASSKEIQQAMFGQDTVAEGEEEDFMEIAS